MDPKILKLSNGITLITDYMSQVESVSLRVLCKVGSRYEEEHNAGISHCIEHMIFKGTSRRNARKIAEEFDMIGGYLNAYTGRERTVYYAKVLKEDLSSAADVLADIIYNSIFEKEELKKEQNVILQEIAESHDSPDDAIFDMLQGILYPNSTMGKPIAGSKESVLSINQDKIFSFLQNFYQPHNIIIGISGNFSDQVLKDLIEDKFNNPSFISPDSALASNKTSLSQEIEEFKQEEPRYQGGDIREIRDIEQAHFIMSFQGAPYKSKDYYVQQIAAIIAGGGMSSRLFQEIREKRGLAYSIGAYCSSYTDCGTWGINAVTGKAELNELINVTIDQLLELTVKINEEELQRAKAQIKSSILMAQESSSSRAERMISNYAIFNRFISLNEIMDNINAIDSYQITNTIKNIIQGSKVSIAGLGNIKTMPDYDLIANKLYG